MTGTSLTLGVQYYASLYNATGATAYDWSFKTGTKPAETGTNLEFYFTPMWTGTSTLKGRYAVGSNWSAYSTQSWSVILGATMIISPNPTVDNATTILLISTTEKSLDYDLGWEIEVVDLNYGKKIKEKVKTKEYKLKTDGWKSGTYVVTAKYNDWEIAEKLQVD